MSKTPPTGPLFTDLYELTMAAAYVDHGLMADATFSLFVRNASNRNLFVAAGLEEALTELDKYRFSVDDLAYLKGTDLFSKKFLSYLEGLRFSGQVHAMPEGTIFFAGEPILEVTAPLIEAQLIETFLLNTIGFQSLITTKAARCVHAANGRPLVDFSLRRTHGKDAGLKVARSTYIAGFSATSNVLAGKLYDLPISGTMAHSYISAFNSEKAAFSSYAETFPDNSVFLIDTFDTMEGAKRAAAVAKKMEENGTPLIGVRLDSGDITALSKKVRDLLDNEGLPHVKIFASSGFDEFKITEAIAKGAMIDAFGVGTKMGVSADAPYFDIVYKLARFDGRNVRKLSPGKKNLSGKKQVFRKFDEEGLAVKDIIGVRDEKLRGATPLLEKVMNRGKLLRPHPALPEIQNRFASGFSSIPEKYKSIRKPIDYPVSISEGLMKIQKLGRSGPGYGRD